MRGKQTKSKIIWEYILFDVDYNLFETIRGYQGQCSIVEYDSTTYIMKLHYTIHFSSFSYVTRKIFVQFNL